jgi:SPP1 family predicted phage head-tail adaptor
MQSGRFRHQVSLQRRTDSQNPSGQVSHSYAEFAEPWARISSITGREFVAAQQVQSEVTTKITIRWRHDVDETCRVVHVVKHDENPQWFDVYDIVAVLPDDTGRRELQLMCKKLVAEGWRG